MKRNSPSSFDSAPIIYSRVQEVVGLGDVPFRSEEGSLLVHGRDEVRPGDVSRRRLGRSRRLKCLRDGRRVVYGSPGLL